jgi:hypothetical protein
MPVHGCHHRLRVKEDRLVQSRKSREKGLEILDVLVQHAQEIHSGGKNVLLADEDYGHGGRGSESLKSLSEALT